MDENTILYTLLGVFFLYQSSKLYPIITKHLIDYYNFSHLFNYDIYDVTESLEELEEKPIIKYEDKFLTEIRKLEKEFQFNEREKEILEEKELNFFNNTQNSYNNKIEEIKNKICDIEIELVNLERGEYDGEKEKYYIRNEYEEEEYTIEDKIKMLNEEKTFLYIEVKKWIELLSDKQELLNKSKEFSLNFVLNLRLEKLINCFVIEMTPQGNVLMTYDVKKCSFKYYSDHTIPYRYLEVVGRKFAKQFNCRPLYVDMEEELELAEKKWEKERKQREEKEEKDRKEKEEKKIIVPEKKNVFAKFKSYNKEGTNGRVNVGVPPKNSIPITKEQEKEKILLKEKANRFTYEGKLINFNFLKKIDRKVVDKKYNLSFSDFKKINKN